MDVILHAGQHKTGSTAVQAFLRDQRAAFAARGILVPRAGMAAPGTHRPLVAASVGEGGGAATMAALSEEFAGSGCTRVLISAAYAKTLAVEGRGAAMIDALRAAGAARVRIVLYVRAPFALANSHYAQQTGALQANGADVAAFFGTLLETGYFAYGNVLRLAERADVELIVRPYAAAAREAVIGDLMATIGEGDLAPAREGRLNMSRGPLVLEAIRRLTLELGPLTPLQRGAAMRALAAEEGPPEERIWAVNVAAERLLAPADAATELLARAAWGRSWREVIGDERRLLNTFATAMARPGALAGFKALMSRMRVAARKAVAGAQRREAGAPRSRRG